MKARDLVDLAARNLREAILRNSLTTLGVAVGVASLVAMLSLGVGLQTLASQRLTRSGLFDAVFVTSRRDFRGPGRASRPTTTSQPEIRVLDDELIQRLEKLPNVTEVYPQVRLFTDVRYAGVAHTIGVMGLPESSRTSGAFEGLKGAYFSSPTSEETILQIDFAKELEENPTNLLGKTLTLRYAGRNEAPPPSKNDLPPELEAAMTGNMPATLSIVQKEKPLRIVGIIESDPSAATGVFGGARVFLPLKTAEQLHAAQSSDLQSLMNTGTIKTSYAALTVRVRSPKDVSKTEADIKQMGLMTFSLLDAARSLRLVFTVFDLFLGLFGSLALTVASLGIINTLVMAILERRREIGVLKALGATDRDVRSLFFAEAGAMGLFGGFFGVALGWLIGQALTWGTSFYLRRQDLPSVKISYVPWWLALGAIGFAVVLSLVAGLYPASRAAKLNPVEALRYE